MHSHSEFLTHGYSLIRAVLDDNKNKSVPVGVAVWNSETEEFALRYLAADERISGMSPQLVEFGSLAVDQLTSWAKARRVPYAEGITEGWTAGFWSAASRIMTTSIRIDSPRALKLTKAPSDEVEALFEALVQPTQTSRRSSRRVDGAVTQALGAYAGYFESRSPVRAFGGAAEHVLRRAASSGGQVIVEAVNLATKNARHDADALVSKLLRIRASGGDRHTSVIIGYIASPGGLNGETHMRNWMCEKITPDVFDLTSGDEALRRRAVDLLHTLELIPAPLADAF